MSTNSNFREIDLQAVGKQVNRTVVEDGLLEIMFGIALILSSFNLMIRSFILNYLWIPVAIFLIEFIRKRFVYPRTGYWQISFSIGRVARIFGVIILAIAVLTVIITIVLGGFGGADQGGWRRGLTIALIIFSVLFFCFIAYWFHVPRWYVHGILIGVAFITGRAYDAHWVVIPLGVWITLAGVYVFVSFLRRNPVQTPAESKDVG